MSGRWLQICVHTIFLNKTFKGKMQLDLKIAFVAIMDTSELLTVRFITRKALEKRGHYIQMPE